MRITDLAPGWAGVAAVAIGIVTGDWLASVSLLTVVICARLAWTGDGLFVLPLAIAFHWMETSLGVFYHGITGRPLATMALSDYRPMVLIGLGCCLALAVGIKFGLALKKAPDPAVLRPGFAFSFGLLLAIYVVTVFFQGAVATIVSEYPSLRQILVTFDSARLGVLFLVLRRLCAPPPRFGWLALIVSLEIVLGITGFFAGFREPIVLAVLALLEVFDRRSNRHWMALAAASVAIMALGILWMGIRTEYRSDYVAVDQFSGSRATRVTRVRDLTSNFLKNDSGSVWQTTDSLVDRMWTVYYPALAVARVPIVLPHTNGAILGAALTHIVTPRVFFPDKGELPSDSDMVRKYSGVFVAGREVNTSIAFGYSAEAFIDFGIPLMFAPVFAFGVFVGFCYALFRSLIWHRELFVSFATVSFWMSIYLFERSWATMLGVTLGFMVYLGAPMVLLDRLLLSRFTAQQSQDEADLVFTADQEL